MVTLRQVRTFMLSLPEVIEQDHHGFPSFRVANKIFATIPDSLHIHIMLDELGVQMALQAGGGCSEELHWGKHLAGVRVSLVGANKTFLFDLLSLAWRHKAPSRLRSSSANMA